MTDESLKAILKAERVEIIHFKRYDRVKFFYPKGYELSKMTWNLKCPVAELDEPYRSAILAKVR